MKGWRCGAVAILFGASLTSVATPCAAGDKSATPPQPEPGTFEAVIANNPISAILQGPKLWTTRKEPEDWVKQTRPKEMHYMPVGVTPPDHPLKVKTQDELDAEKADLDAALANMEQALAHKPVIGSSAAGAKPAAGARPAKAKKPPPPVGGAD